MKSCFSLPTINSSVLFIEVKVAPAICGVIMKLIDLSIFKNSSKLLFSFDSSLITSIAIPLKKFSLIFFNKYFSFINSPLDVLIKNLSLRRSM